MNGSPSQSDDVDSRLYSGLADRLDQAETGRGTCDDDTRSFDPEVAAGIDEYFDAVQSLERFIGPLRSLVATYRAEPPPATVGEYELLDEIGRGGSAIVYRARQRGLNRLVAVKLSRHANSPDDADRMRFEAEAVAQVEHPGIVPVYEVGEFQGRPYFSMKLYEAGSLDARLQEYGDDPDRAAGLVETIARAVHHAHQLGILHRDLKPSNILLDADGRPHVADFGLAKRIAADADLTCTGELIGTPVYIAPERIPGSPFAGPATIVSDVYGLGAILYALLTGRPPFHGESSLAALLAVGTDDVVSPRSLNARVDRDLETICLHCLEKDPQRRFCSALDLAEDLRRWRTGEPISARPITRSERLRRWCRRHPVRATAALAGGVLAIVGIAGVAAGYVLVSRANTEAERHRGVAERQADELRRQLYVSQISLAFRLMERGELDTLDAVLATLIDAREAPGFEWRWLSRRARSRPIEVARFEEHDHILYAGAISPDGQSAATCGADGTLQLWDAGTGRLRRVLLTGNALSESGEPFDEDCVDFSTDGQWLASSSEDGSVRLWSLSDFTQYQLAPAPAGETLSVEFSADSRWLVTASVDGAIRVWDVAERSLAREFVDHVIPPRWAAFSPDASEVASIDRDGRTFVWNRETGAVRLYWDAVVHSFCVAWSPDGAYLATEGQNETVILRSTESGAQVISLTAHRGIRSLDFSPDGTRLAATGNDGRVRIWTVPDGRLVREFKAHPETAWSVRFAPDNHTLLTVSSDASAKVWNDARSAPLDDRIPITAHIRQLAFAPHGDLLAWTTDDEQLWIGDPLSPATWETLPSAVHRHSPLTFSPDGDELAFVGVGGEIQRWRVGERRWLPAFTPPELPRGPDDWRLGATQLVYQGERNLTALTSEGVLLQCRDAEWSRLLRPAAARLAHARLLAVLPDGRYAICDREDASIEIWDGESGRAAGVIDCRTRVGTAAVSPDGRWLACDGNTGAITLISIQEPESRRTLIGHRGQINSIAFSPDGRTLATAGADGTARLWNTATGDELFTIETRHGAIRALGFSANGEWLAIGGDPLSDGTTVSVYQADPAQ